jgi:hypothetical protein
MIVIALAFSLNVRGYLTTLQEHLPEIALLRITGYGAALGFGGFIGLFSKRMACRITSWRDSEIHAPRHK